MENHIQTRLWGGVYTKRRDKFFISINLTRQLNRFEVRCEFWHIHCGKPQTLW